MDAQITHKKGQIKVTGELTVYTAAEIGPKLLASLDKHKASALDLSGVAEFDTAGLQMLLFARRESASKGRALAFREPSPAASSALELCRVPLEAPAQVKP